MNPDIAGLIAVIVMKFTLRIDSYRLDNTVIGMVPTGCYPPELCIFISIPI